MKLLKTLQNPFALIGQGFLVGALIFFAVRPGGSGSEAPPSESGSVLSTLQQV
jgi:hypothetical protein